MPTLGGFLKKKPKKDLSDSKDSSTTPADSVSNSVSSSGLKTVPTNSSQTSYSYNQTDSVKSNQPATRSTANPAIQDANLGQLQSQVNKEIIEPQADSAGSLATMEGRGNGALPAQTPRVTKGKYTLSDFTIQRTLGTGSFGRVHLVQSKHNQRFYAVKVLKKQQVVKMKQVEHTNDERRMLQKVKHPFLITLWGTFQDSKNLYMVMDFVEGGELFSLLRKSQVSPGVLFLMIAIPR